MAVSILYPLTFYNISKKRWKNWTLYEMKNGQQSSPKPSHTLKLSSKMCQILFCTPCNRGMKSTTWFLTILRHFFIFFERKNRIYWTFLIKNQTFITTLKNDPTTLGPLPIDRSHRDLSNGIVMTLIDTLGPELWPKMCQKWDFPTCLHLFYL